MVGYITPRVVIEVCGGGSVDGAGGSPPHAAERAARRGCGVRVIAYLAQLFRIDREGGG